MRLCLIKNERSVYSLFRKRSISITSNSSSDISLGGSRRKKKSTRSKKMDEVERLAEMERQRRQKEAEQRVKKLLWCFHPPTQITNFLFIFVGR